MDRFVASSRKVRLGACLRWSACDGSLPGGMGLTLATCIAVTKAQATRYRAGSRTVKSEILDLVYAVNGFNRDYARGAGARQSPAGRALNCCYECC